MGYIFWGEIMLRLFKNCVNVTPSAPLRIYSAALVPLNEGQCFLVSLTCDKNSFAFSLFKGESL